MKYPMEYIEFLCHFHATRDYFECHEALEGYWKKKTDTYGETWKGLIQVATGMYHERRGNGYGATKMYESAQLLLKQRKRGELGIDIPGLVSWLKIKVKKEKPFEDIELTITDATLSWLCYEHCKKNGWTWGEESNFDNETLVNKHKYHK